MIGPRSGQPLLNSSAITMNDVREAHFVETKEHRRFQEFCDTCRRYRYIGLCYGTPGVGKTLSARHYANWEKVCRFRPYAADSQVTADALHGTDSVLFTPNVVNTPAQITNGIATLRYKLRAAAQDEVYREREAYTTPISEERNAASDRWFKAGSYDLPTRKAFEEVELRLRQAMSSYAQRLETIPDPTSLVLLDEADRLRMSSLEQVRAIFDEGGIGVVLIGMPGIEKRLARYPQLYSRVGFVHEFRHLSEAEVRQLLREQLWLPPEVNIPDAGLTDEDGIAAILRVTRGNFRLLNRLLTQIGRVLEINELQTVTQPVVEAARESLVIGTE